jgi:hypothetical protein
MDSVGPLLLLFSLAGGYAFLQLCYFFKHRWDALEWERNTFEAALVGGVLFVLVRGAVPFLEHQAWLERVRDLIRLAIPYQYSASFVGALVAGGIVAGVVNLVIPREKAIRLAVQHHGGELLILLQDAAQRPAPVSLTMTNRKVYIGFVMAPPSPKYPYTKLLPTVSGYRRDGSLNMVLETKYWPVYEDLERRQQRGEMLGVDPEDFGIVLPIADICSANLFDDATYSRYFEAKQQQPPADQPPL